jgi:hypothetical protein
MQLIVIVAIFSPYAQSAMVGPKGTCKSKTGWSGGEAHHAISSALHDTLRTNVRKCAS